MTVSGSGEVRTVGKGVQRLPRESKHVVMDDRIEAARINPLRITASGIAWAARLGKVSGCLEGTDRWQNGWTEHR
jgi:hypothetical protein